MIRFDFGFRELAQSFLPVANNRMYKSDVSNYLQGVLKADPAMTTKKLVDPTTQLPDDLKNQRLRFIRLHNFGIVLQGLAATMMAVAIAILPQVRILSAVGSLAFAASAWHSHQYGKKDFTDICSGIISTPEQLEKKIQELQTQFHEKKKTDKMAALALAREIPTSVREELLKEIGLELCKEKPTKENVEEVVKIEEELKNEDYKQELCEQYISDLIEFNVVKAFEKIKNKSEFKHLRKIFLKSLEAKEYATTFAAWQLLYPDNQKFYFKEIVTHASALINNREMEDAEKLVKLYPEDKRNDPIIKGQIEKIEKFNELTQKFESALLEPEDKQLQAFVDLVKAKKESFGEFVLSNFIVDFLESKKKFLLSFNLQSRKDWPFFLNVNEKEKLLEKTFSALADSKQFQDAMTVAEKFPNKDQKLEWLALEAAPTHFDITQAILKKIKLSTFVDVPKSEEVIKILVENTQLANAVEIFICYHDALISYRYASVTDLGVKLAVGGHYDLFQKMVNCCHEQSKESILVKICTLLPQANKQNIIDKLKALFPKELGNINFR